MTRRSCCYNVHSYAYTFSIWGKDTEQNIVKGTQWREPHIHTYTRASLHDMLRDERWILLVFRQSEVLCPSNENELMRVVVFLWGGDS